MSFCRNVLIYKMYLIELFVKLFKRKKKKINLSFDPFSQEKSDDTEKCEHIFLPVDSSEEIFACSKCGLVVNRKDLKDVNIFKR